MQERISMLVMEPGKEFTIKAKMNDVAVVPRKGEIIKLWDEPLRIEEVIHSYGVGGVLSIHILTSRVEKKKVEEIE